MLFYKFPWVNIYVIERDRVFGHIVLDTNRTIYVQNAPATLIYGHTQSPLLSNNIYYIHNLLPAQEEGHGSHTNHVFENITTSPRIPYIWHFIILSYFICFKCELIYQKMFTSNQVCWKGSIPRNLASLHIVNFLMEAWSCKVSLYC